MNSPESDIYGWQRAEVLASRRLMFVLWGVKTLFCTSKADFLHHYQFDPRELDAALERLTVQGFVQRDDENYVLTQLGEETVQYLSNLKESQFAHPERTNAEVDKRFESTENAVHSEERELRFTTFSRRHLDSESNDDFLPLREGVAPELHVDDLRLEQFTYEAARPTFKYRHQNTSLKSKIRRDRIARRFWEKREHDRYKPEATLVELPFLQQLDGLGWNCLIGEIGAPEVTLRKNFREVLIDQHLREALPRINRAGDEETGEIWLDEPRINKAIADLRHVFTSSYGRGLLETNNEATKLLLDGTRVTGTQELHQGRQQTIRYIDFEHPERNTFLAINQFRVDRAGTRYVVPDIVLFVNGIPLVVVECKSPNLTNPVEEGIAQLLRYTGQQAGKEGENEAVPDLFYCNALLISTCFFQARAATLGSSYEHFQEWKDPYPIKPEQLAVDVHSEHPSSQQTLVCGMLAPANLLDLLYNFTLFVSSDSKMVKRIARYHQFRAVRKAIDRLTGQIQPEQDEENSRGGIIWHTQGSGKSYTMVFLVRKMRATPGLIDFKVVFVTDRTDLQRQLRSTLHNAEEPIETANRVADLQTTLRPEGGKLVFAMIQKYQARGNQGYQSVGSEDSYDASDDEADEQDDIPDEGIQEINPQRNVLVIVDEAHRSQARKLHANLKRALPNSVHIAFTGTPIIRGKKKKTHEIFGDYIDIYTIQQSEQDGATLPIFYEGREVFIELTEQELLDEKYGQVVQPLSQRLRESLREKYETYREVLEAENLIRVKANDMMLHYAANILPNGFKAMVVAVSRLAAVRYRNALEAARDALYTRLEQLPQEQRELSQEQLQLLAPNDELRRLVAAYPLRATLKELQFAAVISHSNSDYDNDERIRWNEWTDEQAIEHHIENFKQPLQQHKLAFLCVRSMLITGFDAPEVQVLYLDRSIKDHELLQAIARVNRVAVNKTNGLVVDYFGIAANLKEALSAYSEHDVQGALVSIQDELPLLADRHRRLLALFQAHNCDISDLERCVNLLQDVKIRADFEVKLKKFMQSMDIILPRPQALSYIADAQQLGLINRAASATYRDEQLNLHSVGNKVRRLIDEHIDALQVQQLVEPISILDEHFEQKLRRHQSDQTNALDMEHAARSYIEYTFKQEDPAYYDQLSTRLQEILDTLRNNWQQRADALEEFIKTAKAPRPFDHIGGLDARTERPFLGILEQEVRRGSRRFAIPVNEDGSGRTLTMDEMLQLADFTKQLVQRIREAITGYDDFWLNGESQGALRREIYQMLEKAGKRLIEPRSRGEAVADRLVQLAHVLTSRLRTS